MKKIDAGSATGIKDEAGSSSTIDIAFAESAIDDRRWFAGGSCEVPAAELAERSVLRFACERRKTAQKTPNAQDSCRPPSVESSRCARCGFECSATDQLD